jgi:glucan phosphoethanolaminetransferase (alkaline phosphatase superfamily)
MRMLKHALHFAGAGFLIWLVPFVASIPFFSPEGVLQINFWLYKAVMAVVLLATCVLVFRWLYHRRPAWRARAVWIGVGAAAVSVVLDLLTIVLLIGMPLPAYAAQVLPVYSLIVIVSAWIGARGVNAHYAN